MNSSKTKIRIATRASKLALWQAEFVAEKLLQLGCEAQLVPMTTTADRITDRPLSEIGGKGLFVKELQSALLENRADIAVHSLKDLPVASPAGIELGAILTRHSPYDVFLTPKGSKFANEPLMTREAMAALPAQMRIGTSSLRRKGFIVQAASKLVSCDLRGNVDTRIQKLNDGVVDAIILAEASLDRLKLNHTHRIRLDPQWFVPSPGQGALAIEIRAGDSAAKWTQKLNDPETKKQISLERLVLAALGGDCRMPYASYAQRKNPGEWALRVLVLDVKGRAADAEGIFSDQATDDEILETMIPRLKAQGLEEILKTLNIPTPKALKRL